MDESVVKLKSLFLRSLFEWSRMLGTSEMNLIEDFTNSLFECNSSKMQRKNAIFEEHFVYTSCVHEEFPPYQ